MKAIELQINRWYELNSLRVRAINLEGLISLHESIKHLKGLELTEEILLKCGFVRYDGWDDQNYWCLPDEQGLVNRFELFETDNGFELPSGAKCEFLHTLQNCYYFHYLDNELTINL
jgi:hypothetical protein